MAVRQCPKCELRFALQTELDDHCWHDHPEFRHEYPAVRPASHAAETEEGGADRIGRCAASRTRAMDRRAPGRSWLVADVPLAAPAS